MPPAKRKAVAPVPSSFASFYLLDVTSGKKGGPRSLNSLADAAKRAAKQLDAAYLKQLGPDPSSKFREEGEKHRCGLRNLGATCYMNSLLQCLYMNLAFRTGVYQWTLHREDGDASESAPSVAAQVCQAIQDLFGHLELSQLQSYDPATLTSALSLDVAVQQDAQEFNKLLLSFLEELDDTVRSLVESQFRGEFRYCTTCQACQTDSESSRNKIPFYELELNVESSPSVEESLRQYTSSESLEGVECGTCNAKHDATRSIKLVTLPPVLVLQLLRFVYDVATNSKKKVSSSIEFPEQLDMREFLPPGESHSQSTVYQLTAVLMHTGSSANSGHYTARILDQSTANNSSPDWLSFNDEVVVVEDWNSTSTVGNVKLTNKTTADGSRIFNSKTAYMLAYTQVDALQRAVVPTVPESVRQKVAATDGRTLAEIDEYRRNLRAHEEAVLQRNELVAEVTAIWASTEEGDGRWVSSKWLEQSLSQPRAKVGPIDNSNLLCAHGKADPRKVSSMKLISSQAFRRLHDVFGGGPELEERGCEMCCSELQAGEEMEHHLAQPCDEADATGYVDKSTAKKWRKWVQDGVSDANAELRCSIEGHRGIQPRRRRDLQPVDSETWGKVTRIFPHSLLVKKEENLCPDCSQLEQQLKADSKQSKAIRDELKTNSALLRLMLPDSEIERQALPLRLHIVQAEWVAQWRACLDQTRAEPPGPLGVSALTCGCEQRGLLIDPCLALPKWARPNIRQSSILDQRDSILRARLVLLSDLEVAVLVSQYGVDGGLGGADSNAHGLPYLELEEALPHGDGCIVGGSFQVCSACAQKNSDEVFAGLSTFEDGTLNIQIVSQPPLSGSVLGSCGGSEGQEDVQGDPAPSASSKRPRRSCRSGAVKARIKCNSSLTVAELKLLVWQELGTTPAQQCIFFDGAVLAEERTLEDQYVYNGATILLYVDVNVKPNEEEALAAVAARPSTAKQHKPEDGFAGSVFLSSRIASTSQEVYHQVD